MFTLTKARTIEASHQLARHDGKCRRLHGHSWRITLVVQGDALHADGPKQNMVADYGDLGAALDALHAQLDHQHLNDVLGTDMPTSEVLARWCWEQTRAQFPALGLAAVRVAETATSECEYRP